jgi:hypothetical protein
MAIVKGHAVGEVIEIMTKAVREEIAEELAERRAEIRKLLEQFDKHAADHRDDDADEDERAAAASQMLGMEFKLRDAELYLKRSRQHLAKWCRTPENDRELAAVKDEALACMSAVCRCCDVRKQIDKRAADAAAPPKEFFTRIRDHVVERIVIR